MNYLRFEGEPGALPIVPALPGFPFSPQRPTHAEQTHDIWHQLMVDELDIERYAAHGGVLGANITSPVAEAHPESVIGIQLLAVAAPADLAAVPLTGDEQQTRPLSLAPSLSDSPAGLGAWSDADGFFSARFSDDFLLTQASLYWFTNSISTSFQPYWEFGTPLTARVGRVEDTSHPMKSLTCWPRT